jgi:hypothetical protein
VDGTNGSIKDDGRLPFNGLTFPSFVIGRTKHLSIDMQVLTDYSLKLMTLAFVQQIIAFGRKNRFGRKI